MHTTRNLRHIPAALNSIKGGRLDREVDDPEFKAWLVQARRGAAFEEVQFVHVLTRTDGRRLRYVVDHL